MRLGEQFPDSNHCNPPSLHDSNPMHRRYLCHFGFLGSPGGNSVWVAIKTIANPGISTNSAPPHVDLRDRQRGKKEVIPRTPSTASLYHLQPLPSAVYLPPSFPTVFAIVRALAHAISELNDHCEYRLVVDPAQRSR